MRRAVLIVMVAAAGAFGQTFEAASVKPATDLRARTSMRGGPGTRDPGQITYTNVTLLALIQRAYDVRAYQVSGPDWLGSPRYVVAAKVPGGTTKEQFEAMLQNLLAERFHLKLHRQTRQIQGFELSAPRGGAKLKATAEASDSSQAGVPARPKVDGNGYPILERSGIALMEGVKGKAVIVFMTARAQPISALVERLINEFHVPILDKTGLAGNFDFRLLFAPQPPGALPVEAAEESAPDLASALQQQLGLRLTPNKIPTEVLIIDRADQTPVENL